MSNKRQEIIDEDEFRNLSKKELVEQLHVARFETFKYVNKFLELEEKWAFTNLLLKKLNSVRQKGELSATISEGFLKLTNSQACYFCLFNQDNNGIEFKRITYKNGIKDKLFEEYIDKINSMSSKLLEMPLNIEKINSYFNSVSGENIIVIPIIYTKTLWGYLMLKHSDNRFYEENISFMNIFPEHIALILENISLYQESEKQNKRKVEFLAGISHEFKTPLNSIIGFADVLKSKESDKEKFKYLNNISQSSKHLLTLIEDVLEVSKSQYGPLELSYTTFSPRDEITKILPTFEQMIKEKNLKTTYTLTDVSISADVKRFRQLIYNLMSNAIKFNKKNGKINILTYIDNKNNFVFEIEDTGDGISKRDCEKIFNFFSQVNRSQLKRQLGSGVGLALCKMITNAHGGEINFTSKLSKGSTFWFSLPLVNN